MLNLPVGRLRIGGQECRRGEYHAGTAEAALDRAGIYECLLYRGEPPAFGQPLYRGYDTPLGGGGENEA